LFRSLQMTHKCSGKWWILLAGSKFYFWHTEESAEQNLHIDRWTEHLVVSL
jgi:hypothetical protein